KEIKSQIRQVIDQMLQRALSKAEAIIKDILLRAPFSERIFRFPKRILSHELRKTLVRKPPWRHTGTSRRLSPVVIQTHKINRLQHERRKSCRLRHIGDNLSRKGEQNAGTFNIQKGFERRAVDSLY